MSPVIQLRTLLAAATALMAGASAPSLAIAGGAPTSASPALQVSPADPPATKLAHPAFARAEDWAKAPGDVRLPNAIDHRFGPDGVVGSVGYLCGLDSHAFGGEGGGLPSSFDREDTFLGGKL